VGYELLVCDLDGTLIDRSMLLDERLVAAFKQASARGLGITIATGRMPRAVELYREELEIRLPLIYYNGALVRDHAGAPDLLALALPRGALASALDVLAAAPVHPLFFRDEQVYCLEPSLPVRQFCDGEGLRANVIPDPGEFLRLGGFVKSLCIGHPRDLGIVRADLNDALAGDVRLVRTADTYLEMLPAAASKGAALACLAAHLAVPLARAVAVGDQDNDIEMLAAVGVGLAMPHAPDEVHAVAGRIVCAPEQGGLLRSLGEVMPQYFG
jgi:Cof subfamily protein (haloacid dehalogenase superfamily)